MHNPVITLFQSTEILLDLDMVQSWIDQARIAAPTNQFVQNQLDYRQAEVNTKRAQIELTMLAIAQSN